MHSFSAFQLAFGAFSTASLLSLAGCARAAEPAQTSTIPSASLMARADAGLQRVLLSPLDADSPINKGAWQMDDLSARAATPDITPKFGATAMTLGGQAVSAGAKGDFTLSDAIPGQAQTLGMWVYLAPDSNVDRLGFQIYDGEGEGLMVTRAADWTGWKWVEWSLNDAGIKPAWEQKDKNGKADLPLKSVHLAWFSKATGASAVTVDELVAATKLDADANRPALDSALSGSGWVEPNSPLSASLLFTNTSDEAQTADVSYSLQHDPNLTDSPVPDPINGSDLARGAKDWTEYNGKRVAESTLTDGDDHGAAELPWGAGYVEAFQFIDLGKAARVTHLSYVAGDANWVRKVDVAASTDGQNYQPVEGLQGLNWQGKWNGQQIDVPQPFEARFIRLRYHDDGKSINQLRMPVSFSVYDGVADENWKFAQTGEEVAHGTQKTSIAAHDFAPLSLQSDQPLAPGAYRLNVKVVANGQTQLSARPILVMPAPVQTPNARLGLNTAEVKYAPLLKRLGIGWVRFENLKWPMVSPAPGVFKFDGVAPWNVPHDEVFQTYRKNDIEVLPFLFLTPDFASAAPADAKRKDTYAPKDLNQYGNFVFQTVARYGSQKHPAAQLETADKKSGLNLINTYELWNEPNLINPDWGAWQTTLDDYYRMFRPGAEAVKRADPKARVANGGFAGVELDTIDTLRSFKYPDGKTPLDFTDVLSAHFYTGLTLPERARVNPNIDRSVGAKAAADAPSLEEQLVALNEWRNRNKPEMPIWITETGYDTAGPYGIGERMQAARLPRAIMLALGNGVEKVMVYREKGSTPGQHAAAGVIRDDETLKPSYLSYATLIRELNGMEGGMRLPYPDDDVRIFVWPKGDKFVLSAWAVQGEKTVDLNLGRATLCDSFGHQTTGAVSKLALSEFPIYLSDISDSKAVDALMNAAQKAAGTRKAEQEKLEKLRAVLFDFGTTENVGTLQLGAVRRFTPVGANANYDEKLGYGFTAATPTQTGDQHWISDPLERDSLRLTPGARFQFKAAPGHYKLRLSAAPTDGEQPIKISGLSSGALSLQVSSAKSLVEADVTVGNEPIVVSTPAYVDIRWLSLVEIG